MAATDSVHEEANLRNAATGVGTLEWARRTGGNLARGDLLRLMAQTMILRLNRFLNRHNASPFFADAASLRVPDSAVCSRALALLTEESPPWLINHCLRTWVWANLLAMKERRRFDQELLYLASVLHDLGLTAAPSKARAIATECFAVDGAFAAADFLRAHGVPELQSRAVAEAISLHLNVAVSARLGIEAHLLHEGAAMDVIGRRLGEIGEATRTDVSTQYPRLDMKTAMANAMKQQSLAHPRSRSGFLCSHGFISLIRRAPFAS